MFTYRLVCNGVVDCPDGGDEAICDTFSCSGLFKCTGSIKAVCIHISDVCDGVKDCTLAEDENLCDLPGQCPKSCRCLMYAMKCINQPLEEVGNMLTAHLVYISFYNVQISYHNLIVNINNLIALKWTRSQLEAICIETWFSSKQIKLLDYSHNDILEITDDCFTDYENMQILLLNHNKVKYISKTTFTRSHHLLKFDLSYNDIEYLSGDIYRDLKLYILNISHNNFIQIDPSVRDNIKAALISTGDYRLCCIMKSKKTICLKEPKWPQTCSPILKDYTLKVFSLLVAILIIIGHFNVLVDVPFISPKTKKSFFKAMKKVLSLNDMNFGVYIIVIICKDYQYSLNYVIYDEEWRASYMCFALGILFMFTLLHSMFLLIIISISRLVAVTIPFNSHFKRLKITRRYLVTGLIFSILMCIIITCFYLVIEKKTSLPSSNCLFLGARLNSYTITTVTVTLCIMQIMVWISTVIMYIIIVKWHTKEIQKMTVQTAKSQQLKRQALLAIFTHTICWIPSSAILIASIAMKTYPLTLLTWYAAVISPINSIINPIMFLNARLSFFSRQFSEESKHI